MTYRPRIQDYQEAVAHAFDVTPADLTARNQTEPVLVARQVFMALLYEISGISKSRVGRAVDRDKSCVNGALKRFEAYEADPFYGPQIEAAREALQGGIFRSCRNKPVDT